MSSGRRPRAHESRVEKPADSPERDVFKKGGKLQITISTSEDVRQESKQWQCRVDMSTSKRSFENGCSSTRNKEVDQKRFCPSEARSQGNRSHYNVSRKPARPLLSAANDSHSSNTRNPSMIKNPPSAIARKVPSGHGNVSSRRSFPSVRHPSDETSRKRRNIFSNKDHRENHSSYEDTAQGHSPLPKDHRSLSRNTGHALKSKVESIRNEHPKSHRTSKKYVQQAPHQKSFTNDCKAASRKFKEQEWPAERHSDDPPPSKYHESSQHRRNSDRSYYDQPVRIKDKSKPARRFSDLDQSSRRHHTSHKKSASNTDHRLTSKSYHRRPEKNPQHSSKSSKTSSKPYPTNNSKRDDYSRRNLKSSKSSSVKQPRSPSTLSSNESSSSSEDGRVKRMQLLKEKYTKNKAFNSHDGKSVSKGFIKYREDNEEIFDNDKSSESSNPDLFTSAKQLKGGSAKKSNGRVDNKSSTKRSIPDQKLNEVNHILPVQKSKRKLQTMSHIPVSTSSSSSSSSSTSSDSEQNNSSVKQSKWNHESSSDSDTDQSGIAKQAQLFLKQASLKSKPVGPPLADETVLSSIMSSSGIRSSMIKSRNCKFCALNLKTKDDVDRHIMTPRHQIVTGEFFIGKEHLLRAPVQDDRIQCTICNTTMNVGATIERHKNSGLHRQQLHRWIAQRQPEPPVKFYIDPYQK